MKTGRRSVLSSLLVVVAVFAAACSSSNKTKTSTATTAASGSAAGSSGSNVDKAKAEVAKLEAQPTQIPLTTPITAPIPAGKKIVFINCGAPQCGDEGKIVAEAAGHLGWTEETINTDGTAQQVQNAWVQILREKPFGVAYTGTPASEFQASLAQAKAAGIHVVACCVTDQTGNGIEYNIYDARQTGATGPAMANWVVAHSDGKPSAVYVDLPDFPILSAAKSAFETSFKQLAPNGHESSIAVPLSDLGSSKGTDLVVSYLRAHPDVKFVVNSNDALAIGLPSALKAAGLTGINIFGEGPTTTNAQYLKQGLQSGTTAFDFYEAMYGMVDALARLSVNQPVVNWDPPTWILTGDNIPSTTGLFPVVKDSPSQFAALWK